MRAVRLKGGGAIKKCRCLPAFVLLFFPYLLHGQDEYTFRYFAQMEYRGRILNVLPFRFFHEASASVRFARTVDTEGLETYGFLGVDGPGYVMTTGGLYGNSLYFFTADYDLERARRIREERIAAFLKEEPGYARTIKKIRRRPMTILSRNYEDLQFERDHTGNHLNSGVRLRLTDSKSTTYSNIYKIMGVLLLAYNHSILPPGDGDQVETLSPLTWESAPLDFTPVLTDFAALASEGAKRYAQFNQVRPFKLRFQLEETGDERQAISGEAFPGVKIRKDMSLKHVLRTVVSDRRGVREDCLLLEFSSEDERRGYILLELIRADGKQ